MNVAGFYDESISNGLGWRAVLFVSGCPHNCPGCHNQIAQSFEYGEKFDSAKYIAKIKENSILDGITISGGEPLCKENIETVNKFIQDVKSERPELDVWCYTGYTLEQLQARNDEATNETLKHIDVLVDGRFVEERKNPEAKFRGSDNQRLLKVQECLRENKIIELEI